MSNWYNLDIYLNDSAEPLTEAYPYRELKRLTPNMKDTHLRHWAFSKAPAPETGFRQLQLECKNLQAYINDVGDKYGHIPDAYCLNKAGAQVPIAMCRGTHVPSELDRIRIARYCLGCSLFTCHVLIVNKDKTRVGVAKLRLY